MLAPCEESALESSRHPPDVFHTSGMVFIASFSSLPPTTSSSPLNKARSLGYQRPLFIFQSPELYRGNLFPLLNHLVELKSNRVALGGPLQHKEDEESL